MFFFFKTPNAPKKVRMMTTTEPAAAAGVGPGAGRPERAAARAAARSPEKKTMPIL